MLSGRNVDYKRSEIAVERGPRGTQIVYRKFFAEDGVARAALGWVVNRVGLTGLRSSITLAWARSLGARRARTVKAMWASFGQIRPHSLF